MLLLFRKAKNRQDRTECPFFRRLSSNRGYGMLAGISQPKTYPLYGQDTRVRVGLNVCANMFYIFTSVLYHTRYVLSSILTQWICFIR